MKFSVSSEYIIKKIDAFALDLDCEDTEHKYLREIKKHSASGLDSPMTNAERKQRYNAKLKANGWKPLYQTKQ